jgi:hypothetical protein
MFASAMGNPSDSATMTAGTPAKKGTSSLGTRAQYSDETKRNIYLLYPLCLTREDRVDLAEEEGIESLAKLYNLGSRLDATRGHEIDADAVYFDKARLLLRDDPMSLDWLEKHDRYIKNAWRHLHIEKIAFRLRRSEISVAYRARHLGKRDVCYYWDVDKVLRWLGMDFRELFELTRPSLDERTGKLKHTLELLPLRDRNHNFKVMLVSTMSLARVFIQDGYWKRLVDEYGADRYFIKEVLEGVTAVQLTQELQRLRERIDEGHKLTRDERTQMNHLDDLLLEVGGETLFERNVWVSHGHTALNPLSENCFGWFYDGSDEKMLGFDRDPHELVAGGPRDFDYEEQMATFNPQETLAAAAAL